MLLGMCILPQIDSARALQSGMLVTVLVGLISVLIVLVVLVVVYMVLKKSSWWSRGNENEKGIHYSPLLQEDL